MIYDTDEVVGPTPRWTRLDYHPEQYRLWNSSARFKTIPAGRRSGKTELFKRKLVKRAVRFNAFPDGWFVASAPTHRQAKRIFWRDLKALTPKNMMAGKPSESELTIRLVNGAEITVVGMDQPDRIEGRPIDGFGADEFGNMKESVWRENVRPALSTKGRPGWGDLFGVPEGRNHYYKLSNKAAADESGEWDNFHWISADILDPEEIASAMRDLDRLTYLQEYEASFINFEGRAYYPFERFVHASEELRYQPDLDLIFCFDFNVSPGVCVIAQEQKYVGPKKQVAPDITAVIGEVWIPQNSNTRRVCEKLIQDWSHHKGRVLCYGDATGGAKGSAKVEGSDWDLIRGSLKPVFGQKLHFRVPKSNPRERVRINAMNSRLEAMDGTVRMLIDPNAAPHVCEDLEGVVLIKGGAGEIDKHIDEMLTHLSDGLGYYIVEKHPIGGGNIVKISQF